MISYRAMANALTVRLPGGNVNGSIYLSVLLTPGPCEP